jgi:hypothetical protein
MISWPLVWVDFHPSFLADLFFQFCAKPKDRNDDQCTGSIGNCVVDIGVPAGNKELVEFIANSIQAREDKRERHGFLADPGKPALKEKRAPREETEYAEKNGMDYFVDLNWKLDDGEVSNCR